MIPSGIKDIAYIPEKRRQTSRLRRFFQTQALSVNTKSRPDPQRKDGSLCETRRPAGCKTHRCLRKDNASLAEKCSKSCGKTPRVLRTISLITPACRTHPSAPSGKTSLKSTLKSRYIILKTCIGKEIFLRPFVIRIVLTYKTIKANKQQFL